MAWITHLADFSWLASDTAAGVFIGLLLAAGVVMAFAPAVLHTDRKAGEWIADAKRRSTPEGRAELERGGTT